MRVVLIGGEGRGVLSNGLELAALAEGVEADILNPQSLEDALNVIRVSGDVDAILMLPREGSFLDATRSLVDRAGATPVCVLSAEASLSLRLETRKAGAEWLSLENPPNHREIWRRLRGAVMFAESRPELERRTLSQIVVALGELRVTLERLEVRERRTGPVARAWEKVIALLDRGIIRQILYLIGLALMLAGAAVGIDVGLPMIRGEVSTELEEATDDETETNDESPDRGDATLP